MLVEFYRAGEGRLCGWIATPPHRRPFQGSTMAAGRGIVNGHYHAWKHNETTPLKPALDAMYGQWLALRDGERLALEWPVHPLPGVVATGQRMRKQRASVRRVAVRHSIG